MTRPMAAAVPLGVLLWGASLATGAADVAPAGIRLTPEEMSGREQANGGPGTSAVAGIRSTVLAGDPTKPGPYTIRLSVPANTHIHAHVHRDARSGVVASGDWSIGYGQAFDAQALRVLPPGSFYTEPAELAHFARSGNGPVVVYISGYGPTDTRVQD
jgi:hypothetical protein